MDMGISVQDSVRRQVALVSGSVRRLSDPPYGVTYRLTDPPHGVMFRFQGRSQTQSCQRHVGFRTETLVLNIRLNTEHRTLNPRQR